MSKDRGRYECLLEGIESIMTGGVKLLWDILLGETYQWNDNV